MDQFEAPLAPPPAAAGSPAPPARDSLLKHGAALVATLVTTTAVGALHWAGFVSGPGASDVALPGGLAFWLDGLRFSVAVLAILGAHEAGHYLACRYYGVDASLPWFLPVPLPPSGTLGAFIKIRSPIPDRRALFDIAVAGPFAGFLVAMPLLAYGLSESRFTTFAPGLDLLGEPLIFQAVQWSTIGAKPAGTDVFIHPIGLAAWFGLLVTALNLFPVGQLDGGHIAYAVFGHRARVITLVGAAATLALAFVSLSWVLWAALLAAMTAVTRGHHPPTLDDDLPLDATRRALALVAAVMFVICFTPTPIEPMGLVELP